LPLQPPEHHDSITINQRQSRNGTGLFVKRNDYTLKLPKAQRRVLLFIAVHRTSPISFSTEHQGGSNQQALPRQRFEANQKAALPPPQEFAALPDARVFEPECSTTSSTARPMPQGTVIQPHGDIRADAGVVP